MAQVLQTLLVSVTVGQSPCALETKAVVSVPISEVTDSAKDVETGVVWPFTVPLISWSVTCSSMAAS